MTYLSFINQFSKRKIVDGIGAVLPHSAVLRLAHHLGESRQKELFDQMEQAADRMKACAAEMKARPGDLSVIDRFHEADTEWENACAAYDRLENQMERLE